MEAIPLVLCVPVFIGLWLAEGKGRLVSWIVWWSVVLFYVSPVMAILGGQHPFGWFLQATQVVPEFARDWAWSMFHPDYLPFAQEMAHVSWQNQSALTGFEWFVGWMALLEMYVVVPVVVWTLGMIVRAIGGVNTAYQGSYAVAARQERRISRQRRSYWKQTTKEFRRSIDKKFK